MENKLCSYCKEVKLIGEFSKNRTMKDGHNAWCKQCYVKYRREYRNRDPEGYKAYYRKYRASRPAKVRAYSWSYRLRLKALVLTHYGNGKLACVKCGESRLACLSIDHIHGGGKRHRIQVGNSAGGIYNWLRENDYPLGYQTLCMNCQFVKRVENNEYRSYARVNG